MVVLIKYKILPKKSEVAIAALTSLIEIVLEEPHFVSIHMNADLNDPNYILLIEEWKDADYYNGEHKKTPHVLEFMRTSQEFLDGPPAISHWETIKTFTA